MTAESPVDLLPMPAVYRSALRVRAVFWGKACGLCLVLALQWLLDRFVSPIPLAGPISIVILVALAPIIAVALWPGQVPAWALLLTFGVEIATLTIGIHLAGGLDQVSSPLLYPVIIALAGLLLSERAAALATAAAVAAYNLMAWAEYVGWLPHRLPFSRPPDRQAATAIGVSLYLVLFGLLVNFTVSRLRLLYDRLEKLRRQAVLALARRLEQPLYTIQDNARRLMLDDAGQREDAQRALSAAAAGALSLIHDVLDRGRIDERLAASANPGQAPAGARALALSGDARLVYGVKAALLVLLLVFVWALRWFVSPTTLAAAISAAILLALLPTLAVLACRAPVPRWLWFSGLAADVTATSTGIHFGGGVDQVSGPILYTVIIGLAGLLVSERAAIFTFALSVAQYASVAWAEYTGLLAHRVAYWRPPDRQLATVIMVSVYLALFTWLVSITIRQVRAVYRRAEDVRRETVSALSHDLKTPLGIVHGFAEMTANATEEERAGISEAVLRAARQALDLIHNTLDAAAIEGRGILPRVQAVDLGLLVAGIVEQYTPLAAARGVRLQFDNRESLLARVDPRLAGRAIGNLLSNAIKHGGSGGIVEVSVELEGDAAAVHVRDHGPGIPAEKVGQLFRKYGRIEGGAAPVEGTGLGLYIARRFAEAHGGGIAVDSCPGKGCRFTLRLPGARAPDLQDAPPGSHRRSQ